MSREHLLQPSKFAQELKTLVQSFSTSSMPGLANLLLEDSQILVKIQGAKTSQGFYYLAISVKGSIKVSCNRCNQPMLESVCIDSRLVPVTSAIEAKELPDELDPLLVENNKVILGQLVEDELLVHFPYAPMHEDTNCSEKLADILVSEEELCQNQHPKNPFLALKTLMNENME